MIQGMSSDAWNELSKTILVRYVLSYLCGTLYLDPSVSLQRIFAFSAGVFLAFQPMQKMIMRRKARAKIVQRDTKSAHAISDLKREKLFFNARD